MATGCLELDHCKQLRIMENSGIKNCPVHQHPGFLLYNSEPLFMNGLTKTAFKESFGSFINLV